MLAQLTSFPPFPLPSVVSPPADITAPQRHVALAPADVVMPQHRVALPSHEAKMNSLPPLHLLAMLHHVTSPLKPKSKY
jgi:hypothetical protein